MNGETNLATASKRLIDKKRYRIAFGLAVFTIAYNLAEGLLATYFGLEEESLALFGFGSDSFIEVISGLGIVYMIWRIERNPESHRSGFERTALRTTGTAFYILVVALVLTSLYHLWVGHRPVTTIPGLVISLVSILIMWALVLGKRQVGRQLQAPAILADANCTLVCIYMSVILLVSSGIYTVFGIPFIDSIGTLALAYFAFKEGKECFEKAKTERHCCC